MEEIRRKFIIQDNFFLCSSSKVSESGLNSVSLWVGVGGFRGEEQVFRMFEIVLQLRHEDDSHTRHAPAHTGRWTINQ